MSGLFSLFQIAGARSFNDFLSGGGEKKQRNRRRSLRKTFRERTQRKKSSRRKTSRRTSRKTIRRTSRKTIRRTSRKTMRRTKRTSRKTMRRTNRKQNRVVKGRTLSKRKHIGTKGKYKCSIGCKGKSKHGYFKGTEPSPKGLGYCAHCTPLNVIMKGKDGKLWENQKYSKGKRWVKV